MSTEKGVKLEIINWDKECELDLMLGRGFEITEPVIVHKDQKAMNGIQSPRFCSDWADEDAFSERYSCKCGETRGKVFEGETCPKCNTKIEFKDVDLSITGWIRLKDNYIIHPIYFKKLASIIGKDAFTEIITYAKRVSKNGALVNKEDGKTPFAGIGIMDFKERFSEIMDYFRIKKKNKQEEIDEIVNDVEKVFAKSIPVYSSVLRPMTYKGDAFFYNPIDKKYNSIYISTRLLNDLNLYEKRRSKWNAEKRERMGLGNILSNIQITLLALWDTVFEQVNQKEGYIKSEILGGMLNWSSRDVIIPDPTLKSDEIILNYMAFLELYKYEIIGCLVKLSGISENDAFAEWFYARIKYSEKIYEMMKYIIKKRKPKVLINRNPTINYGSILCMRIKDVKKGFSEDYTMSLPLQILTVMNADFDGDIENVVSLKTKELEKEFSKVYNPRYNFFVSRNEGNFNNDMNLFKDQLIGLYEFNNI